MTFNLLFLSTDNAARSIIAEGMFNHLASLRQIDALAFSAGSSPSGKVDHFALEVLNNADVETGAYRNKSWDEFVIRPDTPELRLVITLADREIHKLEPKLPGAPVHVHWPYPSLAVKFADDAHKRAMFELTRQALAYRITQLLDLPLDKLIGHGLQHAVDKIAKS
jgi:arsenate reductase